MNDFTNWLKKLSLSQQLFTLIFTFVGFFAFFYFIYVSNSVSDYTKGQMFAEIQSYQNINSQFYHKGMSIVDLASTKTKNYVTYFYVMDHNEIISEINSSDNDVSKALEKEIRKKAQLYWQMDMPLNKMTTKNYTYSGKGNYSFYSVGKLDDDVVMVTLLNNRYPIQFKNSLLSSVIDITVFVVGIFFIVLMLWVMYLIHPLNQIRAYIEKIKLGKDATLKINREDEIGEVARALVNMREELKRQEKTKEEMIHNISHDLKTPIATIKSYGESIKDGIYPYDTLEKSVDVIIDNAERLEKKVRSLLFMNRVEYLVSQEQDEVMCDMKEVVSTVVLNTKVIRPDIEIETNLCTSYFRGGEEAWRVAVENILENAFRYAKTQIVITLDEKQLCIYNDGPSIKESQIDTLFKPYEKGQGGQFGLGLSIVSKVVTANKYRVVAENVETGGVIFKIMK